MMQKIVNGEYVDLTEDEIAELDAMREAAQNARPVLPDLTMRQFRLGLLHAGLLDAVGAAIEGLEEPARSVARIEFEYATTVVRDDEWVATLAPALGLTDEQVDALWLSAGAL